MGKVKAVQAGLLDRAAHCIVEHPKEFMLAGTVVGCSIGMAVAVTKAGAVVIAVTGLVAAGAIGAFGGRVLTGYILTKQEEKVGSVTLN